MTYDVLFQDLDPDKPFILSGQHSPYAQPYTYESTITLYPKFTGYTVFPCQILLHPGVGVLDLPNFVAIPPYPPRSAPTRPLQPTYVAFILIATTLARILDFLLLLMPPGGLANNLLAPYLQRVEEIVELEDLI
ncbi:hypothetical protein SAICODRAFT_29141 [Saitoella complicata NRRL Y-17804]|uniref:uncharacterized protein n=1 Tax=Saitoella complicata (strain BCRC 22490 / CBS 7301 / JCM 7358 / NBRC 10748 / NRRL Y-17804) TaxID=698492 RepID=UPI000866CA3E|nr:uncharacterized protein SAICODRAFT_29141 [Saitoella complicata NRRL Y-17804]ODQ54920.1 hypothetical protein SAICODRAFT_29141 [Saitoella complicata NRRL Y-17804]